MAETIDAQVVVVGGGPGGYAAAFRAADLGLEVALVDREKNPGGVCLYRGCIPSKALLHVAKVLTEAREAENWGISFGEPEVDLGALRGWKDKIVKKLTGGLGTLTKQRNITYVRGGARFTGAHTLAVSGGDEGDRTVNFQHAILATGSHPVRIPNFATDSPRVMDSTAALTLEDVPERLLVVGGGYIGLELATVYAALGSRVTVVEMLSGLLPGADKDLVTVLSRRMKKTVDEILLNTRVSEAREVDAGIEVTLAGDEVKDPKRTYDRILVAVGRRPNTTGIGLEEAGIELTEKGFVKVDAQRRTSAGHIFAIGDVAGEPMLAHKASHEGRVAAEVIAGKKTAFQPNAIPAVVFTDPELAWCGLTEAQAKEQGKDVNVVRFPWGASGRAVTLDRPEGLTKLVVDPKTERVLGVGIAGLGAGELIAEGVLAVEMAALASDLELSIHPHPTLSETFTEAAEAVYGQSTHVYRRGR